MARARSNTDQFVLARLEASPTPMTAYELLGALRSEGVQSPPVVYRALERLETAGRIHRLEGLNAYFACHGHHAGAVKPIFAVCTECRRVEEWSGEAADATFREIAKSMGFTIEGRTIEVRGRCSRCAGLSAPDSRAACCGHAVRLAGQGAA